MNRAVNRLPVLNVPMPGGDVIGKVALRNNVGQALTAYAGKANGKTIEAKTSLKRLFFRISICEAQTRVIGRASTDDDKLRSADEGPFFA